MNFRITQIIQRYRWISIMQKAICLRINHNEIQLEASRRIIDAIFISDFADLKK